MPKRVKLFEDYSRSYKYKILKFMREPQVDKNSTDNSIPTEYDSDGSQDDEIDQRTTDANDLSSSESTSIRSDSTKSRASYDEPEIRDFNSHGLFHDSFVAQDILELSPGQTLPTLQDNTSSSGADQDDLSSIQSADTSSNLESSENSDSEEEASSTSEQSFFDDDISNEPLYPGAPLSLHESLLSVLLLTIRHKISDSLLSDILLLISTHCIEPHHCLTTKYKFKKYFDRLKINYDRHYYCPSCYHTLPSKNSSCVNCHPVTDKNSSVPYFITLSILAQLSAMFLRSGFYNLLNYRFTRNKTNNENKEDIYDGDVYKSFMGVGHFLSKCTNISFTWNTDGVSPFKSSKFNVWPFFLRINELPFLERIKPENTILAGLWFGFEKPDPNKFMAAFYDELKVFYNGLYFNVPNFNIPIFVRGFIMNGTLDLPAKALFLNMSPHMARYGCQKCKIASEKIDHVQCYRFTNNLKLRTTEETIEQAEDAVKLKKKDVQGVKGPTFLSKICYDFIRTTAVDSMHCVDLGVTKKLISLLFDKKFATHKASLYQYVDLINARIRSIRPPCNILRQPRLISDMKYWKAHEFRTFLLYYSLPLLHDLMDKNYFDHLKFLVLGVTLLHQESVSDHMITLASRLFTEFVGRYEDLYGLNHMTCNLHHLLHLPDVVKDLGPLWVTSCYPFENLNGLLKRLIHGTRYVQLQISSAITIFINLTREKFNTFLYNSKIALFCERLEKSGKNRRKLRKIYDNTSILGNCKRVESLPDDLVICFSNHHTLGDVKKIYEFQRLFKNRFVYESQLYKRKRKINSTFVKYFDIEDQNYFFGVITKFIQLCFCNCHNNCENCISNSEFYAIINKLTTITPFETLSNVKIDSIHLCKITDEENLFAVKIDNLKNVCYTVEKFNDNNYLFVIDSVYCIDSQ
ncbi:uncharacterized protein LOC130673325 [Microplitis mediator]|uniref:uncharacterized protein LOC130673325 n=1 Tax=Microplitis mediator TaxID=375433 RepID=UPI00255702C1|nr:uncharacterized protein LOC130673325 [Microplitis mediator]